MASQRANSAAKSAKMSIKPSKFWRSRRKHWPITRCCALRMVSSHLRQWSLEHWSTWARFARCPSTETVRQVARWVVTVNIVLNKATTLLSASNIRNAATVSYSGLMAVNLMVSGSTAKQLAWVCSDHLASRRKSLRASGSKTSKLTCASCVTMLVRTF